MRRDNGPQSASAHAGLIRQAVVFGLVLLVLDILVKLVFGGPALMGGPFVTNPNAETQRWLFPSVPLLISVIWYRDIARRWPIRLHLFATAALAVGVAGAGFDAIYVGGTSIELVVGSMPIPNSLAEGSTLLGVLVLLSTPMRRPRYA